MTPADAIRILEANNESLARSASQLSRQRRDRLRKRKVARAAERQRRGAGAAYDRSGLAKTRDFMVGATPTATALPGAGGRRIARGGRSTWKQWEPQTICRAAFAGRMQTCRDVAKFMQGSHSHVRKCSYVVASTITDAMHRSMTRLHTWDNTDTDAVKKSYAISNNMHDETKLFVTGLGGLGRGAKRQRILACKSQYTLRDPTGVVVDLDIIRPPKAMKRYTAASVAAAVADPKDCTGLWPGAARPPVRFFGSLQASDQHSVNVLLSKWVAACEAAERADKRKVPP